MIPCSKYQQEHCILAPCWAFLCRHGIGFLAGPTSSRMGKRPAFFVFGHRHSRPGADKKGRRLVRRIAKPAEAAMHPSVRPSTHLSSTAGISNVRQVNCALIQRTCRTDFSYYISKITNLSSIPNTTSDHMPYLVFGILSFSTTLYPTPFK